MSLTYKLLFETFQDLEKPSKLCEDGPIPTYFFPNQYPELFFEKYPFLAKLDNS